MKEFQFTDDLFVEFYNKCSDCINNKDSSAAFNFYQHFSSNRPITKAQADYALRILQSYQKYLEALKIEKTLITAPKWRNEFKVLDYRKYIFVEQDANNTIWICVKHPFNIKEKFEKECITARNIRATWDDEAKIRRYHFYSINVVLLKEFGINNGYELSKEFIDLTEQVEDVWSNQELYNKSCVIDNNEVILNNPTTTAEIFFDANKTGSLSADLMLAKSMEHQLLYPKANMLETVCSFKETNFWITDRSKLFNLCKQIDGKVVLLLGRDDEQQWIDEFANEAVMHGFIKDSIKVCFRHSNSDKPEFNNWVKDSGFGGKTEQGKFLLFKEKPPKWLLESNNDVTIIVLTGPFLPSSSISQAWINQHHCVIFLGKILPSLIMDKEIVKL